MLLLGQLLVKLSALLLLGLGGLPLLLDSPDSVDVLLRERQHFGQQVVLVVILKVVDAAKGRHILVSGLLDVLKHLLVFEVLFPEELVVVVFLVELVGWLVASHHAAHTGGIAL